MGVQLLELQLSIWKALQQMLAAICIFIFFFQVAKCLLTGVEMSSRRGEQPAYQARALSTAAPEHQDHSRCERGSHRRCNQNKGCA